MTDRANITMTGAVIKFDEARRVAYGWASVIEEGGEPIIDAQGDVIKAATLLTAAHGYILDARAGKVMHHGKRVADVVESVVLTHDLQETLGIDIGKVGWFIGMKIRDDEVWEKVLDGTLQAFSIGGVGIREELSDGD